MLEMILMEKLGDGLVVVSSVEICYSVQFHFFFFLFMLTLSNCFIKYIRVIKCQTTLTYRL